MAKVDSSYVVMLGAGSEGERHRWSLGKSLLAFYTQGSCTASSSFNIKTINISLQCFCSCVGSQCSPE